MKKIYLAPSRQEYNTYAYGNTNEAVQCNAIADRIKSLLGGYDCECRVGLMSELIETKAENANNWGADVYLSIHTNAGGGKGTEVWYNPNTKGSKAFAQAMYDVIAPISPGKDRGLKSSTKYDDVEFPKMPCCLCEIEFHDYEEGAKWIINNTQQIAEAFVKGLVSYLELKEKQESSSEPASNPSSDSFKIGDLVKITGTKWYTGENIPSWVKAENWYISEIKGDRAVIDKNEKGTNSIKSPINTEDISLVKDSSESSSTRDFEIGDLVKVTGTKWYTGAEIPSWVKSENWYISEIKGDRAVIDKNEKGTNSIESPINIKDISLVRASSSGTTERTLQVGDLVKITGNKYYNGVTIPSWVKSENWYISEIKGDRAVIDKNERGTNSIESPINIKDIVLVR